MGRTGVPELHIVVACSDRKRSAAGAPVCLGDIEHGPVRARSSAWWRALSAAKAETAARDLYAGDHWAVARGLPALARARGFHPTLWVASGGYGLVPETARLAAYSATFAPGSADSVLGPGDAPAATLQAWWAHLARHRLRGHDGPRSLCELASRSMKGAFLVIVGSPAYVTALETDLEAGADSRRVRVLVITSSPGPSSQHLADAWIPTSASLRMCLGGALTSTHVRVARELLSQFTPSTLDPDRARRHVEMLAAQSPAIPTIERTRADDDEIRIFIRSAFLRHDSPTHTVLLRQYRASGRACEQSRFRELFRDEERNR